MHSLKLSGKLVKWPVFLLIAVLIAAVTTGCGSQNGQGGGEDDSGQAGQDRVFATITDDLGNEVRLEEKPEKIVSLSPANTEILFALGLADKVVGRTDYCNYPEAAQSVPSVGDFNSPNVEMIVSMGPDLVLSTDFIQDDVRNQLEAAGAAVAVYRASSIDGVIEDIRKTGIITGTEDKANEIAGSMAKKREEIKEKAAEAGEKESVFIDIGDFYSAGKGSLLGSILDDLGLENIAADAGSEWPELSTETIIAKNPDIYLSLYTPPAEIKKLPGFGTINAVKNDRIVFYEMLAPQSDLIQRPGPRIVDGLEQLARDFLPQQFPAQ